MYEFFISYYMENGTINNSIFRCDSPDLSSLDIQILKKKLKERFNQGIRIIFFTRLRVD